MHPPVLVPDFTLFIQLALFLASYLILKFFVFQPFLDLITLRQEKTEGLKEQAALFRQKGIELKTQYVEYIQTERKKKMDWMEIEKQKSIEMVRATLAETKNTLSIKLEEERDETEKKGIKAKQELTSLVADFAGQIASKYLGRKVEIPFSFVLSRRSSFSTNASAATGAAVAQGRDKNQKTIPGEVTLPS